MLLPEEIAENEYAKHKTLLNNFHQPHGLNKYISGRHIVLRKMELSTGLTVYLRSLPLKFTKTKNKIICACET